jgi:hypothetical protein
MPLYMDIHNIEGGVSAADVAGAHLRDLETQSRYGVKYLRYWVDEDAGKIFSASLRRTAPTTLAPSIGRHTISLPTRSTPSASTADPWEPT